MIDYLSPLASRLKPVFVRLLRACCHIVKRATRRLWDGDLKRLESELELERRQRQEVQRDNELLQRHVDTLNGRVERSEYEQALATKVDELQERLRTVEADAAQRSNNVERTMALEAKKQRDLQTALQERSKELEDARKYVTTIDEVSEREVVDIVGPLNGQILQVAASLSDAPEFHLDNPFEDATDATTQLAVSSWVGPELLALLVDHTHEEHLVCVQLALQAGLTKFAQQVANSWDPSATTDTTVLENVYESMRAQEPQSVVGRWRALGYSHLKRRFGADHVPFLVSKLSAVVTDILFVAGAHGAKDAIAAIVFTEFSSEIRHLVTLALKFHDTVGERVVSRDFTLLAAEPGEPLDVRRMEVEYPEVASQNARVLVTTQLGLVAERFVERDGRRRDLQIDRVTLLKCNVVLQDAL